MNNRCCFIDFDNVALTGKMFKIRVWRFKSNDKPRESICRFWWAYRLWKETYHISSPTWLLCFAFSVITRNVRHKMTKLPWSDNNVYVKLCVKEYTEIGIVVPFSERDKSIFICTWYFTESRISYNTYKDNKEHRTNEAPDESIL